VSHGSCSLEEQHEGHEEAGAGAEHEEHEEAEASEEHEEHEEARASEVHEEARLHQHAEEGHPTWPLFQVGCLSFRAPEVEEGEVQAVHEVMDVISRTL